MKAILSADRKWGLGYQGRLLVSIPSDLRFFRETTMGHVVVMGRKTLATLPAGQPLKGRTNIILSRDPEWTVRGATVVHSIIAVAGVDGFYGFVSGVLASDYDCTDIFVDATLKITGRDYEKVAEMFEKLAKVSGDTVVTCTISADNSELPESMKKYII